VARGARPATRWVAVLVAFGLVAGVVVAATAFRSGSKPRRRPEPVVAKPRPHRPRPHGAKPRRVRVRGPHDEAIPILMYHVIGAPPAGAPYPELYVTRRDFARQIAWLAQHRYHAVALRQAYDYWRLGYALPPRPVVLSFDDGYRGDYTAAMPILARYRWAGVLNLAVHNEDGALWPWQIRQLVSHGWEIDAHTINHVDLTTLGSAALRHEVLGSRQVIRRQFHVPVKFFCYPSGRFDDKVIAAVRAAGFLGATTVNYGSAKPSDGWYTLDRVRIDGSDGLRGFASKLRLLAA
jgi:peptidoglycan/xylan/chitin deacetylase (PgdA/CDA1 family)